MEQQEKAKESVANGNRSSQRPGGVTLLTVLIVVAVLYFARTVLIPLALALLLAFLLAPLVTRLRHWGLWRGPSTVLVVLLAFGILGSIGAVMVSQLGDLGRKLPGYQQNIHRKLEAVRASGGGIINRVTRVVHDLNAELTPGRPPVGERQPGEVTPFSVEVRRSPFSPMDVIRKVLGSVLNVTVTAGIVIVFVIFMLVYQEDLRDRIIRLGGARRVGMTTTVLADAASRVSKYLLAQLVVNVAFGVLAGIGLHFIGVPNPLLWGMLAAVLRYIPYLGIWIAAIMPSLVAFAVEPDWLKVLLVPCLYLGIDLLMYNIVEPLFYGSSTGVSPMAILVAAVFWTWLWGPVGLLLATPLTVCVVVIGRHVPNFGFLSVLLSDEPVLGPETRFYQRMLALDLEEATEIAEEFLKSKTLGDLYDAVIVPALSLAEEDRHRGKLDHRHQQFIFENTRMLIEDLAEREPELVGANNHPRIHRLVQPEDQQLPEPETEVLCIPVRDDADELAAQMFVQLLGKHHVVAKVLPVAALASERLEEVRREKAKIVCLLSVPPFGYTHVRYLSRRLRCQFPEVKLLAAILTEGDPDELKQRQLPIQADELASSLRQAQKQVLAFPSVTRISAAQAALK